MIYALTGGQHKPPKHVLLPYAVKTLTGNIEVIRLLNQFWHGALYQKLATSLNQRVSLPAQIKLYVFTNFSWDNIDRLEETLTGKCTSHHRLCNVYGPYLPPTELPRIEKKKQRSVRIEHEELEVYEVGAYVGPQCLLTKERNVQEFQKAVQVACKKNPLWVLARKQMKRVRQSQAGLG